MVSSLVLCIAGATKDGSGELWATQQDAPAFTKERGGGTLHHGARDDQPFFASNSFMKETRPVTPSFGMAL